MDASVVAVAGVAVSGFLGGFFVGIGIGRLDGRLADRLGSRWHQRVTVLFSVVPFSIAAGAAALGGVEPRVGVAALASTVAVTVAGWVAVRLAETCYVDSITDDDPVATWQWEPPGNTWLYGIFVVVWLLDGVKYAVSGRWMASIAVAGFAISWLCIAVDEGVWQFERMGATPAIRVHEAGLVIQRPFRRSIVLWEDVSHVRLRDDELVFDRGFFDVRFDRDEVADLEAVQTDIERILERVQIDGFRLLPR
ncbi:hypothetical protein [Natrinema halophilum]|nr:hypothetical protein [Natrinema halophilum]QLG49809.2 hypothetical protein HYG82_13540 [Natrinema halophilum]